MAINGTVVRLVSNKGFGFVRRTGSDVDFFFHRSAVEGAAFEDLREGQAVSFEEGNGAKGPRAERVQVEGLTTRH